MTELGSILERNVQEVLLNNGFETITQPSIGGLRPDFIVLLPNIGWIVLEVKNWDASRHEDARHQAHLYKTATGAQYAFIVTGEHTKSFPSKGVISIKDLPKFLRDLENAAKDDKKYKTTHEIIYSTKSPTVFAAMPFSDEYEDVFLVAMAHAANSIGGVCIRVDREKFVGDIVEKIKEDITESIAVIADLSESKPNVLYEVGFAHALGKPVVHICSTPLSELPFDVKTWNTILYKKGQTHALKEKLADTLRAVVK